MLGEARISTAALSANAARLVARDGDFVADLSFDAYGHGALAVAHAARESGALRFAAATDTEVFALRDAGYRAELRSGLSFAAQLYGFDTDAGFVAAMDVIAPVVGLKAVEPGDGVSYGYTFRAVSHSTLALVGIGYADGLDRSASNIGTVLLAGRLRPIVGRVAMNVIMVDLGDDSCALGEDTLIFGAGRPAAEWAREIGRPVPEVVLAFGCHLPRVWS